jgi:hypothetical protein
VCSRNKHWSKWVYFEGSAKFKHSGKTAVSENDIPDPSRRTVKVGNSYYLIQDLSVSSALSET